MRMWKSCRNFGELSFMNGELKDIDLIVKTEKNQWKFGAHKLVLSCASSYFQALLQDESTNEIILDGLTPTAAYILLRYMYCGDLQAECWDDVIDLIHSARSYKMEELVCKIGKFLEDVITLQNVCYIYDKASTYSLSGLQHKCLQLILDSGFIVLKSHAFQTLNKNCVNDIISNTNLNIDSEYIVFEALFAWARLECCRKELVMSEANIVSQIEPFLEYVCIDDMSDAEKSALPPSIQSNVNHHNHARINFYVPPSLIQHSSGLVFEINYNCLEFLSTMLTCIRFSVTHSIYFIGVEFMCVEIPSRLFHLKVVKENNPSAIIAENFETSIINSTIANANKTWFTLRILFKNPVYLTPTTVYNIYAADNELKMQSPQTKLSSNQVHNHSGQHLHVFMHASVVWGITKLSFV